MHGFSVQPENDPQWQDLDWVLGFRDTARSLSSPCLQGEPGLCGTGTQEAVTIWWEGLEVWGWSPDSLAAHKAQRVSCLFSTVPKYLHTAG